MIRRRCFFALLTSLLLGGAARAQLVTNVIDRFDTNSYPGGSITNTWRNWFGSAFQSTSLDVTNSVEILRDLGPVVGTECPLEIRDLAADRIEETAVLLHPLKPR